MSHPTQKVEVFFDGSCPLCTREIGLYRKAAGNENLRFVDIADDTTELPGELTREKPMARFHVRGPDGELESGAAAFATLWKALPGWRWLGRFASLPVIRTLLGLAYQLFLPIRPYLQRMAPPTNSKDCRSCES